MNGLAMVTVAVAIALAGCASNSDDPPGDSVRFADFRGALDEGANCADLIELKNRLDPELHDRANRELRNLGCYSATSERQASRADDEAAGPWKDVPGRRVVPSSQCMSAMETASAEKDPTGADPLITASLSACTTVDEWLSALEIEPGVMGMVDGTTPDLQSLQIVCHKAKAAAVCVDAARKGIELP